MLSPGICLANIPTNMDHENVSNLPAFPSLYDATNTSDLAVQQLAMNMETARCEDLKALDDQTKHSVLLLNIFLQSPGALSRIVRPDCQFLGDVAQIAQVKDAALTLSDAPEILYYLTDRNVLIVAHAQTDSIAYALFPKENTNPLEWFLEHRTQAEDAAQKARAFKEQAEKNSAPVFDEQEPETAPISSSTSSASQIAQPTSSIPTTQFSNQPDDLIKDVVQEEKNADTRISISDLPPPEPTQVGEPSLPFYVDTPSEELPRVQPPTSPQPQPQPQLGTGRISPSMLALIVFSVMLLIGTAVVVLKTRVNKKDAYLDS